MIKLMVRMEKAKARYEDPAQGSLFGGGESPKRPTRGSGKGKLVPKKVSVSRGGKNFQQTVWVKPGEDAQASRSGSGEKSQDGFKLIEAANKYAVDQAKGDRKEYLKRLNAQKQLPHRIREYRAENRDMPARKDAFLSGIEKMLKEAKEVQPEMVDSREKLKALGKVEITSVGSENVYFKDSTGWEHYFKADDIGMRADDFSEGDFDMGSIGVNAAGSGKSQGRKEITLYDLGKQISKQRGGVNVPMDQEEKKLYAKWYGITEKELESAMFAASSEWKGNNRKVKIKSVPEGKTPSHNNVSETPYGPSPTTAAEYSEYLSQMLADVPSRKKAIFDAQVEMSGLSKEEQLKALEELGVDVESGNVLDQFKSKLEYMQRKVRAGKETEEKAFVKDQDKKRQDAKLQGMVAQAEETVKRDNPDFDPDTFIKIAADSWEDLRSSDVYRLLDEAWPDNTQAMADAIVKNRSDLKGEVDNVLKILSPDKGPAPKAREELGGKLEAERVGSFMESAMKQAYDQHVNNLGTWMEKQKAAPTAKRQVVKQIRERFPEFAAKVDDAIKNRFRVTSGSGQSFLHFTKKDGTDKIVSDWPRSTYPKYQIYLDAVNELTNEIRNGR
jgi:hypothetical protein